MNAKKKPDHGIKAERLKDRAESHVRAATLTLTHYLGQIGVKTSDPDVRAEISFVIACTADAGRDLAMADVEPRIAALEERLKATGDLLAEVVADIELAALKGKT